MSSDLSAICASLAKTNQNPKFYDDLILQFISSVQTDPQTLGHFENDPSFSQFISGIFTCILRLPIPKTLTGQGMMKIQQILDFLIKISLSNPHLLKIIAEIAPLEDLVTKLFRETAFDRKQKVNANPKLLIFVKFIAILASEPKIKMGSSETFSLLFTVCEAFFNTDDVSEWALSIIAGFIKNCASGAAFVKSQPKFGKLKTIFASLLSSKNVSVVLTALANLVLLFPSQIAPQVSIQTAINALGNSDKFPLTTKISTWIIYELHDTYSLSTNELWSLLSSAIAGGPQSYYLYLLMSELPETFPHIIDVIASMNCLFLIINSLLETQYSFNAVTGCTFLNNVFRNGEAIVFSNEVKEPFLNALKVLVAPSKYIETDKKEAAAILLRFLVRSRDSTVYVIPLLKEYQDKLFFEFQRQVQNNNAFLSVQMFLFMFDVSHFIGEWHQILARVVLDSQFPALIVHVMNESMNRQALEDALIAMQIVTGGLKDDTTPQRNVLFDTIVEGHLFSNKHSHDVSDKANTQLETVIEGLLTQINELEVEKDCCARELEALKQDAIKCSIDLEAEINTHQNADQKRNKLIQTQSELIQTIQETQNNIENRKAANELLQKKIYQLQRASTTRSVQEAGIRTKSNDINKMNRQITELTSQNAKLEELFNLTKQNIEKQKKDRAKYVQWLKKGKEKTEKHNKILDDSLEQRTTEYERNTQLKNDLSIAEQQIQQITDLVKEDQSQKKAEEEEIQRLKNEIEEIKRSKETNQYKATLKLQALDQLKEHMIELETKNNEMKMLIKLLHKSTYPNMKIPENVSALFNLQPSDF